MNFFRKLGEKHEKLKQRIHSFRIPLGPTGQRIMGFVYFSIPVVGGYFLMQFVTGQAAKDIPVLQKRREHNPRDEGVREQNEALEKLLQSIKEKKEREDAARAAK